MASLGPVLPSYSAKLLHLLLRPQSQVFPGVPRCFQVFRLLCALLITFPDMRQESNKPLRSPIRNASSVRGPGRSHSFLYTQFACVGQTFNNSPHSPICPSLKTLVSACSSSRSVQLIYQLVALTFPGRTPDLAPFHTQQYPRLLYLYPQTSTPSILSTAASL